MMDLKTVVFCGPSGVGKSTLLKKLLSEYEGSVGFSVSHTTRSPRPGEQGGKDYHFVSVDEMKESIENGDFIEYAEYSGNYYGTSRKAVQDVCSEGKICILDIDVQGVCQVKESTLQPKYIFIKPPSMEALEERLRGRKTESVEGLRKRLSVARKEIEYGEMPGNFDLIITNEDIDAAYSELKEFMMGYFK